MQYRKFIALALALFAALYVIAHLHGCSRPALSPQDVATIARCQQVGRDCKADGGSECYGRYDACMADGGMR